MQIKAKMSDVDGGPEWLDRDHVEGTSFGISMEWIAAKWAENEARAILAETEPQSLYTSYNLQSAWSEDTLALTEALSQFISKDLEA